MQVNVRRLTDLVASERWDFGVHDPEYLAVMASLDRKYPVSQLGDLATLITDMGAFSLYRTEFFVDQGVPFLRVQNVQEYGVDLSKDTTFITPAYHAQLVKSQLQPNDLLLTTKAIIGMAAVVDAQLGPCNISQNLVRIQLIPDVSPYYVAAFLNSRLGRMQTERAATGTSQRYLNFERIKELRIPVPPPEVQGKIAKILTEAFSARSQSLKDLSGIADTIGAKFLESIGINYSAVTRKRSAVVDIKKLRGNRFDFEAIVALEELAISRENSLPLSDLVDVVNERVLPAADLNGQQIKYVSLSNINSNTGELVDFVPVLGDEILSSSPTFRAGDILYGKMRPYLNKVWIAEFDGVCSGETIVLRPKDGKVDSNYLHALLLSRVVLDQIVPLQSGTSLPRISPTDLLTVRIPFDVSPERQKAIGADYRRQLNEIGRLRAGAERIVSNAKERVVNLILGTD